MIGSIAMEAPPYELKAMGGRASLIGTTLARSSSAGTVVMFTLRVGIAPFQGSHLLLRTILWILHLAIFISLRSTSAGSPSTISRFSAIAASSSSPRATSWSPG